MSHGSNNLCSLADQRTVTSTKQEEKEGSGET